MHVCTKISKATLKFILKIIYKITKYYCMWYQDNFSYEAIDWDHLLDEWNGLNENPDMDAFYEHLREKE